MSENSEHLREVCLVYQTLVPSPNTFWGKIMLEQAIHFVRYTHD